MAKILYVEDDADLAEDIMLILEEAGHSVTHVTTAEIALKNFKENACAFDIIISDNDLGAGMKGAALSKRIYDESPGKTPPFILITARDWDEILQQERLEETLPARGHPIAAYIQKKIGFNKKLLEAIESLSRDPSRETVPSL